MHPTESRFIHNVYFYLRENGTPEDAAKLLEGCLALATIPGVLRLSAGTPAPTAEPRSVVDTTYAVALLMEFADAAAQDAYQVHPEHEHFVATYSPLWQRVQVYDTVTGSH